VKHPVGSGTFLIASPLLQDPNFNRTVVLLCEHDDDEGSMGLVVNRPLEVALDEAIEGIEPRPEQRLFFGGPVQREIVLVLHRDSTIDGARAIVDGMELGGDPEQILSALHHESNRKIRVFSGYAGWGAGQLRAELDSGSWVACPASARFVFDVEPDAIWAELLRSLGPRYAYLLTLPNDPRVN
jgi:putative transcriptional regulator